MPRSRSLLIGLALTFIASATVSAQHGMKSTISWEMGGFEDRPNDWIDNRKIKAQYRSVNFDLQIMPLASARVGYMWYKPSRGQEVNLMPLTGNLLLGSSETKIELGAGPLLNPSSDQDLRSDTIPEFMGFAGMRYVPHYGGLSARIGVTRFFFENDLQSPLYVSASLGWTL